MADLAAFEPAARMHSEGNGEGDVMVADVGLDVPLAATSIAGLQVRGYMCFSMLLNLNLQCSVCVCRWCHNCLCHCTVLPLSASRSVPPLMFCHHSRARPRRVATKRCVSSNRHA